MVQSNDLQLQTRSRYEEGSNGAKERTKQGFPVQKDYQDTSLTSISSIQSDFWQGQHPCMYQLLRPTDCRHGTRARRLPQAITPRDLPSQVTNKETATKAG